MLEHRDIYRKLKICISKETNCQNEPGKIDFFLLLALIIFFKLCGSNGVLLPVFDEQIQCSRVPHHLSIWC